jgi:taurine dioxygenase
MQTKMLGPGFAVEVTGIDPSRPVSASEAEKLRSLLDRHELLVLRAPELEPAAHVSFMGLFGPVYDEYRDNSGLSYVSNVVGAFPNGRLLFHQDFAFTPYPHRVQSLYAQELEGDVAPTLFVSNTQAFERLTPAQKAAWQDLTVVHARDAAKTGEPDEEYTRVRLLDAPDGDDPMRFPRGVHKVISHHPRTGAPFLFVSEYYSSHVPELPPEAGERVIQEAFAALYRPEAVYAHPWRLGDLVIWDNIALQHARSDVKPNTRRTLRRVLVNDHLHEAGFRESAGLTYDTPRRRTAR